jgi:hypothetical protein
MKNIRVALPFVFLFFIFCLFGSAHAETVYKENIIVTSDSLEQRGKQIHAEVIQIWENLKQSKSLRRTNDISDIVAKHIPIGTSFADAEVILRSAGFNIWPQETAVKLGVDLAAGMIIETISLHITEVYISIWSEKQNVNQNTVGRVTCTLSYTTL